MEDSNEEVLGKPHPRLKANWLSEATFWWTMRIFKLGRQRELEVSDLCGPLESHRSAKLGERLEKLWQAEVDRCNSSSTTSNKKIRPSMLRVILKMFGMEFTLFALVLLLLDAVIKVCQPLLLGQLLRFFTPGSETLRSEAYWAAAGLAGCSFLYVIVLHPYIMGVMHLGMKIRVAACALVYRKSLRLSANAVNAGASGGRVVNLMSNDVTRFEILPIFIHEVWMAPLELILCCYLMWRQLGVVSMLGVTVLLLTIPLQLYLGRKTAQLRAMTATRTDERVRLMNEILNGVRVIKMYAWEFPFAKLVAAARRRELQPIRFASYIRGINLSLTVFTTRVAVFISLLALWLLDHPISADKVFVMASYFSIIRQAMVMFFPKAVEQIAESLVSVRRIEEFMMLEEIKLTPQDETKDIKVCLQDVTASWTRDLVTLRNVSLNLMPGRLAMVIGAVGAGKSSLLHTVLGELPSSEGHREVKGRLSYVAQEPWLFSGTIRQNVLFGEVWDPVRYRRVLRACALERDLVRMPEGDLSLIGERGVTLSGGQRARVGLARAVYRHADIYVLDDPLSAVDAHVARHLVEEVILGLLRESAVLLATHQLHLLPHAAHITLLHQGRVEVSGSYAEVRLFNLERLLVPPKEIEQSEVNKEHQEVKVLARSVSVSSTSSSLSDLCQFEFQQETGLEKQEEMRSSGTVAASVYAAYLRASGGLMWAFFLLGLFFAAQLVASGVDLWLTFWTNLEEARTAVVDPSHVQYEILNKNATELTHVDLSLRSETCVLVYGVLVVTLVLVVLLRFVLFVHSTIRASRKLHDAMFEAITRATMFFFASNPAGRILNRFSRDLGSVDEFLPQALMDTLQIGLNLLGTLVVVVLVSPWMLVPALLMSILFYWMRSSYLATARSLKRLDALTVSPIFTHVTSSLHGITTVRASQAEAALVRQFDNHQDLNSSAWYLLMATGRGFGYCLDVVCATYIALVTASFLGWASDEEALSGNVGLAITSAIGLTGMIQWGVRQSAELENHMTSVERLLEFSHVESEPPLQFKHDPSIKDWPSRGEILFEGVSLKYPPSEVKVLDRVTFTVNPGEKVGIVGRTGAGKSSLISVLFHLAEVCEGRVLIDSVDTTALGLHKLRSSISIIPQEPVLFSGTVRKNLDPFEEHPDDVLWRVLAEVELKEVVKALPAGLYASVSEAGSSLSVGQRQLVCLARAVLRRNLILVLDEATANVDPQTDEHIQRTIQAKFAHCTVLTIAHRIQTILNSNRVLVMDAGCVREFDSPKVLLNNRKSLFARMAKQQARAAYFNENQD